MSNTKYYRCDAVCGEYVIIGYEWICNDHDDEPQHFCSEECYDAHKESGHEDDSIECESCGDRYPEDEMSTCSGTTKWDAEREQSLAICDKHLCSDCSYTCEPCGDTYCDYHIYYCESCEISLCDDEHPECHTKTHDASEHSDTDEEEEEAIVPPTTPVTDDMAEKVEVLWE